MQYFSENGYPKESLLEYLLNMINSGFEIWRKNNPELPWQDFKFDVNQITTVAPIFDIVKLNDISKNIIAKQTGLQLYQNWLAYAEKYDIPLAKILKSNSEKFIKLCQMDRDGQLKPRKDIYNYSMMKEYFSYIFNRPTEFELDEQDREKANELIKEYLLSFEQPNSNEEWFNDVKMLAQRLGYAIDNKQYKQNPESFKGNTAKACEFIRVAITGRKNSPTLFNIIDILGEEEIKNRLKVKF